LKGRLKQEWADLTENDLHFILIFYSLLSLLPIVPDKFDDVKQTYLRLTYKGSTSYIDDVEIKRI